MAGEGATSGSGTGAAGGSTGPGPAGGASPSGPIQGSNSNMGGTAAPPPQTQYDWQQGFNDEYKGYVAQKGFKDPTMLLDSYKNLEKLMGGDKNTLLRMPNDPAAPEWQQVYDKMGRPSTPAEYGIQATNDPNSKAMVDWAKNSFHELGLSRSQGEKLVAKYNDMVTNQETQTRAAFNERVAVEDKALRKEWGMAYDQNIQVAKQGMKAFGLTGDMIDSLEKSMGFGQTMKFIQNLGSKVGEDSFLSGNSHAPLGVLTPDNAKGKIALLKKDSDFVRRYTKGEAGAIEELTRLHKYAYPDESENY